MTINRQKINFYKSLITYDYITNYKTILQQMYQNYLDGFLICRGCIYCIYCFLIGNCISDNTNIKCGKSIVDDHHYIAQAIAEILGIQDFKIIKLQDGKDENP